MRGIGRYATGGRTVVPYSGDMLRYGYGPEHQFFTNNSLPWVDLGPLTPEEMGTAGQGTAQPGITGGQSTTAGDVASGLITAGTGAVILDKLTGGAISGGLKSLFGGGTAPIPPNHPDMGTDSPLVSTPAGGSVFADDQWLADTAAQQPDWYSSFYTGMYPDNELIRAMPGGGEPNLASGQYGGGFTDVYGNFIDPYNTYPDVEVVRAQPGGGQPTVLPGGWEIGEPYSFGLDQPVTGSTYGEVLNFDDAGNLIEAGAEDEIAGGIGSDWLGDAGDWASSNLLGGPQEAETLWGMDVNNPIADKLAGAAAIYGAVQNPNPSTILQGAGGAASLLGYLPGFGTAYGLYNGIIAGMKFLTGAGDKVPWGAAAIPVTGGSFGNIEVNGGYGGDALAARLGEKAAAIQTEVMMQAQQRGIDLAPLLGRLGNSMIDLRPTGTRENPDADRPMVRLVNYQDERGFPTSLVIPVANDTGGVIDDPKVIAGQLLNVLVDLPGWTDLNAGFQDYGHAEGGPILGGAYPMAHAGPVKGPGGGQDDPIPALLSDGEHVVDAETVSMLGDGSNDEGHRQLELMKRSIRSHKRSAPAGKIPPKSRGISSYMRAAHA